MQLVLSDASFSYDGSSTTVLDSITASFPTGWTGIVGPNGVGKTTLLRIATDDLTPCSGTVSMPGDSLYCAQLTDAPPTLLDDFAIDWGADAARLRSQLDIGDDWPWRFHSLSHGERKRLQLAVALWRRPIVLAVDEPTNHLDGHARELIRGALRSFDGIGLIVSHDRDLLDDLVERCLLFGGTGAVMRPGNYTQATMQAGLEAETAMRERGDARREMRRLQGEASRRRTEADRAHALRSRRHLDKGDSDGRARIGNAIVSGKDGRAGRLSAQLESRLERVTERLRSATVEKSYAGDIWLPQGRSRRSVVAVLEPQRLVLAPDRELVLPALVVGAQDRIGVEGPNGAGKSTLVRRLLESATVESERILYMPQEMSSDEAASLLGEVRALGDAELGELLAIVSRLGSRPERILDGGQPSPGEIRKIMVALGILREPHLIVLDEPTNHLDLPATEALEDALAGCPCALVLISHDVRFLSRLARVRWHLAPTALGDATVDIR
jgi:macrolide transport system ATP-binding/permease protein